MQEKYLRIQVKEHLKGTIDFHVHPGPDPMPRVADAFEMVTLARNAGMRGIVFKCFEYMTPQLATILERHIPGISVFGSICLEGACGGFNPRAVEMAIRAGAKVVFMPALDTSYNRIVMEQYQKEKREETTHLWGVIDRQDTRRDLRVLEDGKLAEGLSEILDMTAEHNLVVQTSHMYPEDRETFVEEAQRRGVKKIVFTHANASWAFIPLEEQKKLAEKEGVYFEYSYPPLAPGVDKQDPNELVKMIRAVGPEKAVLGSDAGVSFAITHGGAWPHPTEALAALIGALLTHGMSEEEIDYVSKTTPAKLLNLK